MGINHLKYRVEFVLTFRSGKHLDPKDRVVIFLRKLITSKHTANLYVTEQLNFHCYRCDKLISVIYLTTLSVIPNYSQQDATFLDLFNFAVALHVSGFFFRPSSEAHNCTYSFMYCQPILLLAAVVEEMFHLFHDSS
jgi:hypothetical protein